jgi:hypothetical protein
MEQDIEPTKSALKTPMEKFSFPGVIYVEHENGNIAPVIVIEAENDYTEYFWDNQRTRQDDRYNYIKSAFLHSPNSQSSAKLFVINNATDADIERVLEQASKNKKPQNTRS